MSISPAPLSPSEPRESDRFALGTRSHPSRRLRLALRVGWHSAELDRRLAAGVSPWSSDELALRARRLISRRGRARLASGLTRAARDAQKGPPGFSAAARPDAREVLAARTVLDAIARRLGAREPVAPRGVAMLQELLTDGTSPLYRPGEKGALGSLLRAAAVALEPPAVRQ